MNIHPKPRVSKVADMYLCQGSGHAGIDYTQWGAYLRWRGMRGMPMPQ